MLNLQPISPKKIWERYTKINKHNKNLFCMTEADIKIMEEEPLQKMKDLTAQWANYFNGIQQVLEENKRLHDKIDQLNSENEEQQKRLHNAEKRVSDLQDRIREFTETNGIRRQPQRELIPGE